MKEWGSFLRCKYLLASEKPIQIFPIWQKGCVSITQEEEKVQKISSWYNVKLAHSYINRLDCIVLRYSCAYPQLQTECDVFAFYFVSYYSVIYTREEFNFVIPVFVNQKIGKKIFFPHKMEGKK